jgi:hypothetical protein
MREAHLLPLVRGLVPPWMVKAVHVDGEARRLETETDVTKGGAARFGKPAKSSRCGSVAEPQGSTLCPRRTETGPGWTSR